MRASSPSTHLTPLSEPLGRSRGLRTSTLAVLVGALAGLGCGRKHETAKKSPVVASATPAKPATAEAAAAPNENAATEAPDETETAAPAAMVRVSGPALLQRIRTQGSRATLVNIWATWCGPCRRELPMFRSLADSLRASGVSVVLVSVDEPEHEPTAIRMLTDEGFTPPFYVAERPLEPFKTALHPGWPGVIPATFLFDGTGKRRYFWGGPVYDHELLPIVEGLLEGKAIDGEARFDLAPGAVMNP